jgi:hypothetical protein
MSKSDFNFSSSNGYPRWVAPVGICHVCQRAMSEHSAREKRSCKKK